MNPIIFRARARFNLLIREWRWFWLPVLVVDRLFRKAIERIYPSLVIRLIQSDIIERYRPVVAAIEKLDSKNSSGMLVLDVGGGTGGIAKFLAGQPMIRSIICDISMQNLRLARRYGWGFVIKADACSLPFASDSIPIVVCVHTLEHIYRGFYRNQALKEMKRVTCGRVILEGPIGETGYRLSEIFVTTLKKLRLPVPSAAVEHLECGIPEMHEVASILQPIQATSLRNLWVVYTTMIIGEIPLVRFLSGPFYSLILKRWDQCHPHTEAFVEYIKYE